MARKSAPSSAGRFTPEQQAENFRRFESESIKSKGRLGSRTKDFNEGLRNTHRSLRVEFFGAAGDKKLRAASDTLDRLRKVRRNRIGAALALIAGAALAFRGTGPRRPQSKRSVGRPRLKRSAGRPRATRRVGRPSLNRRK